MKVFVLFYMLASTLAFSNQNVYQSELGLQLNEAAKTSKTELEMIARPEPPQETDEEKLRVKLMRRLRQEADDAKLLAAESRYRHYLSEGNFEEADRSWSNFVAEEVAKRRIERMAKIKALMGPIPGVLRALYFPWFGMFPGQNP
jgi:hypothetical protein